MHRKCVQKDGKKNSLQMTRLISAMESRLTFSKAMKTITLPVIDAIAKVTHTEEHSERKINSKKIMNVDVNATIIF